MCAYIYKHICLCIKYVFISCKHLYIVTYCIQTEVRGDFVWRVTVYTNITRNYPYMRLTSAYQTW